MPARRLAVLAPGGPILIDWRLAIDGKPVDQPLAEIIDQVMQASDVDQDGRPSWAELTANRQFLEGPLVGLAQGDQRQPSMWIEQFDYNGDGRVQRDEASDWLGRDANNSAKALSLRSSRSGYADPRWTSRIWQLLDQDRSGDLSTSEIEQAPAALRSRDEDDNQIIVQAELAALLEQLESATPPMATNQSGGSRKAAIWIGEPPDVERLDYLLVNLYAPRQFLGPNSFRAVPALFEELDASGDQWLAKSELARIATIEPHLLLDVQFPQKEQSDVRFEIRHNADGLRLVAQSDNRLDFALGGDKLVLFVQDFAAAAGGGAMLRRSQIDLMVHDQCDAVFETLDANSDGQLGEREIAQCGTRLLETDANSDGRLVPGELPRLMILAASRAEPAEPGRFYVPRSASGANASSSPQWFLSGDFNGDGDLSRREFLGSADQFAELDLNDDGFVSPDEAAEFEAGWRSESRRDAAQVGTSPPK